jgi:hypothetical protein
MNHHVFTAEITERAEKRFKLELLKRYWILLSVLCGLCGEKVLALFIRGFFTE